MFSFANEWPLHSRSWTFHLSVAVQVMSLLISLIAILAALKFSARHLPICLTKFTLPLGSICNYVTIRSISDDIRSSCKIMYCVFVRALLRHHGSNDEDVLRWVIATLLRLSNCRVRTQLPLLALKWEKIEPSKRSGKASHDYFMNFTLTHYRSLPLLCWCQS